MTDLTGEASATGAGSAAGATLVPLKSRKVGGGSASYALAGSAVAIALGVVLAGPAEPLSGHAATGAVGSVAKVVQVALSGQAITSAQTAMSAPLATTPEIGGNIAGHNYFGSQLLLVNIVQNGGWDPHSWLQAGTLLPLASDSNGDPPTDFRVPPHYVANPHGVAQVMHARCTEGWIDTITTSDAQITISNKQYSGNTTTFDITFASTWFATPEFWYLNCTGTRRTGGPTGATNTGVADFVIAAPGYTTADIATKRWTDEFITYLQTVTSANGPLRTMDMQSTNFSTVVNFSELPQRTNTKIGACTYEDMIDMANRANRPLHMQAGFYWSDACVTSFVQLVESRLNPNLHIYFGFSNEHWNSTFTQNHDSIRLACVELKGFVGTEGNRSFSATRSANIVTLTTVDDHQWTSGQSLYFMGFDGVPDVLVVTNITVTGPKTATFQRSGADGSIFVGSGQRVIGNLNSNLRLTTTYPGDTIDPYYLAERLCMRRTKEISDLVRAVVGDAAMQTRWRITWEDQGFEVNPDDPFRNIVLNYLKNKWTGRAVNEYVYRWDYAPYFYHDPYKEAAGATVAQVVGALQTNCGRAKTDYFFELRKAVALQEFGIQVGCYEGGADTKSFTLNGSDLQVRCAAQFDPGIQAPIETMLADWFKTGAGAFEWYTIGFLKATEANRDAVWGVTDDLTNLTAPKIAAMVNVKNNPPVMTRNAIPGVLDGRTVWCGAYAGTTYGNLSSFVGHLRALLFAPVAGTYTIKVRYTCNQSGRAANIRVNRNLVSGSPFTFTNQGTGVSHDTLRGANGSGTLLLADIVVSLNSGANAIDFARTATQGDDVEFYSLQVV